MSWPLWLQMFSFRRFKGLLRRKPSLIRLTASASIPGKAYLCPEKKEKWIRICCAVRVSQQQQYWSFFSFLFFIKTFPFRNFACITFQSGIKMRKSQSMYFSLFFFFSPLPLPVKKVKQTLQSACLILLIKERKFVSYNCIESYERYVKGNIRQIKELHIQNYRFKPKRRQRRTTECTIMRVVGQRRFILVTMKLSLDIAGGWRRTMSGLQHYVTYLR